MRWTKKHSRNAVAAKARLRIERAGIVPKEVPFRGHQLRPKAKFSITLKDLEHRDSITLRLYRSPWPGQWICSEGNGLNDALGRLKMVIHNAA